MDTQGGIQSVNKALGLLSLFEHDSLYLGITEISNALELPKGTVHGIVRTLLGLGFLRQEAETKKYCLGLKIYELGVILAGRLEINQRAAGPAHRLAERCSLTSRIAIWDGDAALLMLNIDPRSAFYHQIGPRIPAYCSAVGKAILAYLDPKELSAYLSRTRLVAYTSKTITHKRRLLQELRETHQRGYSIDHEETTMDMVCVGAPIFGRKGRLEGSISLSGDSDRMSGKAMERWIKELLKTAREISASMGYFPQSLDIPMKP